MNSYQIRFISKFVLAIFLAHICLVFAGTAHADCSDKKTQVQIELDDLEDAERALEKLQEAGPMDTMISHILRMDVEGSEVPILKTYPFHIKPLLLSVEHHSKAGKTLVRHILEKHGYQIDAQNAEELRGCLKRNSP